MGGGSASFGEGGAAAGAGPAVEDDNGASRRAPWSAALAAVEAFRAFPAAVTGADLSAAGFGVVPASAAGRLEGLSAAGSSDLDGGPSTHASSASGFARPGEPRGFRAGADNALTHFGF
jgi:hypothetical protein